MELTNPLEFGIFGFVLFIVAELLYTKTLGDHDTYEYKDMFSSISTGLIGALIGIGVNAVLMVGLFHAVWGLCNTQLADGTWQHIFGYESFSYFDAQNNLTTNFFGFEFVGSGVAVWLLCQLLDDFTYYWFHRLNHTVRFLWAAHIVHHSSDYYNFGTGVRNGWFTLMYKPFFYMWLPAIGFHPSMVIVCLGIEALWQFQLHTKLIPKLGFIEKFMNTYTMHQAHHSQNLEYLDKNHGGYLNIFDRIFGTYAVLDDDIDIKYGVIHAPNSYNPFIIATHEYSDIWRDVKKSKNLKEAFMYTFGPPGWSPDGSTLTVRQIHRKLKEGYTIEQLQGKA